MQTIPKNVFLASVVLLGGGLAAALSFWAIQGDEARELSRLEKNALCVLDLQAGASSASASITTSQSIERFEVGMRPKAKGERLSLSISGSNGLVARVTAVDLNSRFGLGQDIPPGTYEITLRQEAGDHGAFAVVAAEKPVLISGWQVWSRFYFGLLLLSGIWAFITRKSGNANRRTVSMLIFRLLLLGFAMIFLYLLAHEGGHALAELSFGRYDFARSDFWGIHGHPHSGGRSGPPLEPWQQAILSGAGPMLPTLSGWVLFLLWNSRLGRNLRSVRPIMNLYCSAIVAILVFPALVVTPGILLGVITRDAEWAGFIGNVPGPMWLMKGVLWGTVLVSVCVLWRTVPDVLRGWRAQFQEARNAQDHTERPCVQARSKDEARTPNDGP